MGFYEMHWLHIGYQSVKWVMKNYAFQSTATITRGNGLMRCCVNLTYGIGPRVSSRWHPRPRNNRGWKRRIVHNEELQPAAPRPRSRGPRTQSPRNANNIHRDLPVGKALSLLQRHMSARASQITANSIIHATVCSSSQQRRDHLH